jgi:hypothetical protein
MSALAPTRAWAQVHLEPDESVFASPLSEYYAAVRKVLLSDVPHTAVTVVTIPSFDVEWSAWVVEKPEPQACSRVALAPIWNGEKPNEPQVPASPPRSKCVPLAGAIAKDIAEVWAVMLRGVRNPPPSNVITVDGTSYHFSGFDQGQRLAGMTVSPMASTATGRLVTAAEALRAYIVAPSPEGERSLCRHVGAIRPEGRRLTVRCSPRADAAIEPRDDPSTNPAKEGNPAKRDPVK